GPVLNREHGFLYWSAVITTAPFDVDGREAESACPAPPCRERWERAGTTHWIGSFQKVLEETLNEPDKEKRKMLLYGDFFTRTLWAVTYSGTNIAQCFECMRVCPAAHGLKEMT